MSSLTSAGPPVGFRCDLARARLDRLARPAPRRPELDDHRHVAREDLGVEGRVGDLVHPSKCRREQAALDEARPRSARQRSTGTWSIASSDDRAAHLRLADAPVDEGDRDLDDREALPQHAVGRLDLEAVARAAIASRSIASSTSRGGST